MEKCSHFVLDTHEPSVCRVFFVCSWVLVCLFFFSVVVSLFFKKWKVALLYYERALIQCANTSASSYHCYSSSSVTKPESRPK